MLNTVREFFVDLRNFRSNRKAAEAFERMYLEEADSHSKTRESLRTAMSGWDFWRGQCDMLDKQSDK